MTMPFNWSQKHQYIDFIYNLACDALSLHLIKEFIPLSPYRFVGFQQLVSFHPTPLKCLKQVPDIWQPAQRDS